MANNPYYSLVTEEIEDLARLSLRNSRFAPEEYTKHDIKRGLRDVNGRGVLAGLTQISEVCATRMEDGKLVSDDGQLFYRGYNVKDIVKGVKNNTGYEETAYLLLFGQLPNEQQLKDFIHQLSYYRSLPTNFVRDVILKAPSQDMMNSLARSVLTMASYDTAADNIELPNVVRQCMQLIAVFPMFCVYGYQAFNYYKASGSLYIHSPNPGLSTAENILSMLRPDSKYSPLEANILDICLLLHAEHGGGNNSTFTTHVVTSSGTDTYSCMAAALASLKGPRHGGANIKVIQMFEDMKAHVGDWNDDDEIKNYLQKLLNKQAFDNSGLIYGMGHAVYSLSDPRALVLKDYVEKLSKEKGMEKEFHLYTTVERLASKVIADERKIYKGVSANVDFYSGFVYKMLNLPTELYTPIFAVGRLAGWSAHRIEELINMGKIIRPAYVNVQDRRPYIEMNNR